MASKKQEQEVEHSFWKGVHYGEKKMLERIESWIEENAHRYTWYDSKHKMVITEVRGMIEDIENDLK